MIIMEQIEIEETDGYYQYECMCNIERMEEINRKNNSINIKLKEDAQHCVSN